MKTTGHVLPTKLLIKQHSQETITKSGIILIESEDIQTMSGVVVVAGEGTEKVPMVVEVGDEVIFPDHSMQKFKIESEHLSLQGEYILLDQSQVLFITKNK